MSPTSDRAPSVNSRDLQLQKSGVALPVRKHRSIDNQGDEREADGEGGEAEAAPELHDQRLRGGHEISVQFSRFDHLLIFAGPVALEFLQRHAAREHHRVDGEFLRAEVGVEEVHGEDEAHRQQRFVAVDDGGDVNHPTGKNARKKFGEPEEESG